jgi:N-acetylglutamate synthase-like GNAT family acetyltransferase
MIHIRTATAADQAAIQAMVRGAGLNPINVRWPNFRVAEEGGRIVGVGQMRPHGDGVVELASLTVIPEFRRRGIGAELIGALMAGHAAPVYLFCEGAKAPYYARHGFRQVGPSSLPRRLARIHRLANILARVESLARGGDTRIIAMRWDG